MTKRDTNIAEGLLDIPPFKLPLSDVLSEEAREVFMQSLEYSGPSIASISGSNMTEEEFRTAVDRFREEMANLHFRLVRLLNRHYKVETRKAVINGVPIDIVTPQESQNASEKARVLINLHGGGFVGGAEYCGLVESIPVSHLGRVKVVSVDYRQGYEHKFPAASEDVATVYESLLTEYDSSNIGVFGYSAGGSLTAQVISWFLDKGLPVPGAAAICSSGAGGWSEGDSGYWAPVFMGQPAIDPFEKNNALEYGYLSDVDSKGPLVAPLYHQEVLAQFPPTLLLSGTRSFDLSGAVSSHRALLRAGAEAELHVWEGLWHCFSYNPKLPEAREAYDTLVGFFAKHLSS